MKSLFLCLAIVFLTVACGNTRTNKPNRVDVEVESSSTLEMVEPIIDALSANEYDIMLVKKQGVMTNYYVFVMKQDFDKTYINDFARRFKKQYSEQKQCNIHLYDTDKVKDIMTKYPLKGKEYVFVADHFVGVLSFDDTNEVWWYPFQDIQYKEFGGKNWKKDPIE